MDDIHDPKLELGHGLDQDAADIVADDRDSDDAAVCGPGDGDAVIMTWARAM